ncbi:MAG: hypothetical protein AAGB24_13330 [Bacteroidota bacterium]
MYLERGLDILSNKKEVNFELHDGIRINEVGVIRDKKEHKKILVLKMDNQVTDALLRDYTVRLRARIKTEEARIENWDFVPSICVTNGHTYLTKEIEIPEDKINKLVIYLYRPGDEKKRAIGNRLELKNLFTYND